MGECNVFEPMRQFGHEQVVFFQEASTGLLGITAIHDTTLGPALGGTRLWKYATQQEALTDCLRLARGMTYKSAAAGLNLGGGKTVLIGDPQQCKSEAYFRALGRFVQSLGGRYITAEDVNTNTRDMGYVAMETGYVVGLEGRSGNPSPVTARGVFHGIRAGLSKKYGDGAIRGRSFAVQGAGQTGYYLIGFLVEAGAGQIWFTEINPRHVDRMNREYPQAAFVPPEEIYGLPADVFCPCALGGILNGDTIPRLKAGVVAGSANNALLKEEEHGQMLLERDILYCPDFVINAGGLINVSHEMRGYVKERVMADVEKIHDRLLEIFELAETGKTSTQQAAKLYAEQRIEAVRRVRSNYIPR